MLNIWFGFGDLFDRRIHDVSGYFDGVYEQNWFSSDLAREIVKGIDNTEYIDGEYFQSPVLGGIPPRDLSSGCKGVLLALNEDDIILSGERFGDNCCEWLLEVAKLKDVTISLNHIMDFKEPFSIRILNTNRVVTNSKDYVRELLKVKGVL